VSYCALKLKEDRHEPTKNRTGCMIISPNRSVDHILPKKKTTGGEPRRLGRRVRQWDLERAVALEARRPRGKRIHSCTLLQEKLRQRCLLCGRGTPAISRAGVGAGRRRGLRGATYVWRGRTSKGRVCLSANTEPLSPTGIIPVASTLSTIV
jgi:hypothetical protein